jgi:hypothetical protein
MNQNTLLTIEIIGDIGLERPTRHPLLGFLNNYETDSF